MVTVDKRWKHNGLAKMDMVVIQTPIKQILMCLPTERTPEEQELYDALMVVIKHIDGIRE